MKKFIFLFLALLTTFCLTGCEPGWGEPKTDTDICYPEETEQTYAEEAAEKPVISLYPEEETDVTVKLDFAGKMTA